MYLLIEYYIWRVRGVVWCGVVWCGEVRCGAVRCGAVRCGAVMARILNHNYIDVRVYTRVYY